MHKTALYTVQSSNQYASKYLNAGIIADRIPNKATLHTYACSQYTAI